MKTKILWFTTVLLALAAWLFENGPGTLTVLSCTVLLPVLGALPLLFQPELSAGWEMPTPPEKGAAVTAVLVIRNKRRTFLPCLKLSVSCHNLRTGTEEIRQITLPLNPMQEKRLSFALSCMHCGRMETRIRCAAVQDLFGIFYREIPLEATGNLTVMPDLFSTEILLHQQDMASSDSDTYSAVRPGNDPGETFSIREYIPGDSIRRIHWKLSEKTDRLLTREFGLPVVNEVLLLLETIQAESEEDTDAITEVFASACQALAEQGIVYRTGWREGKSDALTMRTVSQISDLASVLSDVLEAGPKEGGSVARRFTEDAGHCGYAHVIVVGAQIPADIRNLYNGNRVSVLLPRRNGICEGLQPDGTYVLTFDTEHYATELSMLEV